MLSPFEAAAHPSPRTPLFRTRRFMQVICAAVLIAASFALAPASQVTAVPISDDLTENIGGWIMVEEPGSAGSWSHFDASGTPPFTSPISGQPILESSSGGGTSYFVKDQSMPSAGVLYLPLTVPMSGAVELAFDYFVQSNESREIGSTMSHTEFPNQQFRVDIVEDVPTDWFTGLSVLVSVLPPTIGTNIPADEWSNLTLDLTEELEASRGSDVYLAFREVDNQGFLTVGIDNVQFSGASATSTLCEDVSEGTDPDAAAFACAIASDQNMIVDAEILPTPPPGPPTGVEELGAGSSVATTPSGDGWRAFEPEGDTKVGPNPIPEAINGSYELFENGASESDVRSSKYTVPFTVPAGATMAQIGYYFFLQSQADPEISGSGTVDTSTHQRFIVEIEDLSPGGSVQTVFEAEQSTEIDGLGVWNSNWIDLVTEFSLSTPLASDLEFTISFHAVASTGGMQAGVDMVELYTDARDATKKTFGVSSEDLLAFPRQGAEYGVMSTGDAERLTAGDQSEFISSAFGGDSYAESDSLYDLTRISIDLAVPLGSRCLSLDLRFLSEEFPEYVGSKFNDAFLAELNPGLSSWDVIPDDEATPENEQGFDAPSNFAAAPTADGLSTTVLSINTTNEGWFLASHAAGTPFDGSSILLRATTPVDPTATTAELVLTIFDQGDQGFDSAVMMDALTFWPNAECAGQFVAPESSVDPSASPSSGVGVVAPIAVWGEITDPEVYVTELPLTLNLEFDQPVDQVLDTDILNVGDSDGCVFEVTALNENTDSSDDIPNGSATEFAVEVTDCGVGRLQPQLEAGVVSGAAENPGPAFNVTSFPIDIRRISGGGSGSSPSVSPSPSPSSSPSASPSAKASATPSVSASKSPSYSVQPSASPTTSGSPTPQPSAVPTASSGAGGGGGSTNSGGDDNDGWSLPQLPDLAAPFDRFWLGVLFGVLFMSALWTANRVVRRIQRPRADEA